MSGLNTGSPTRLIVRAEAQILSALEVDEEFNLFGPQAFKVDWSLYDFFDAQSLLIKPTDTKPLPSPPSTGAIDVILLKTTAPVDVAYTQDSTAKTMRVSPLVSPSNFFTLTPSPSQAVPNFQFTPGILIFTGGNISAVSVNAVSGATQAAKVIVALAGYNVLP